MKTDSSPPHVVLSTYAPFVSFRSVRSTPSAPSSEVKACKSTHEPPYVLPVPPSVQQAVPMTITYCQFQSLYFLICCIEPKPEHQHDSGNHNVHVMLCPFPWKNKAVNGSADVAGFSTYLILRTISISFKEFNHIPTCTFSRYGKNIGVFCCIV